MKYLSVAEIAKQWNISERRVRVLCSQNRIPGVMKSGSGYLLPERSEKPIDGRTRKIINTPELFLMWGDHCIGTINSDYCVRFTEPAYNSTVRLYTKGKEFWDRSEFESFLSSRIISHDRRDIEKILFRLGLSHYDTIKIALKTRAINAKDLIWIAYDKSEKFEDVMTIVFNNIFLKKKDLEGSSVDSPEGYNIKRYGVYQGKYGIYKKRINPLTTDVESERAVYMLSKLFGIDCCPAYLTDDNTVFSEFCYDFSKEYIVHFRNLIDDFLRTENEYENLLSLRPQYQKEIIQMICLDFITRQDDRHLSNIAVKISSSGESFYPLYDNGRSLFYDETEETVKRASEDIELYSTSFGPEGTYYDFIKEIASSGVDFSKIINLDVKQSEIAKILKQSGFTGYRLNGSIKWIMKAVNILKKL